jgi:hypothetical protein
LEVWSDMRTILQDILFDSRARSVPVALLI